MLLLDWMTAHGQAARVVPADRSARTTAAVQGQSLIALGEPPAISPLSYDRAVLRLAINQMQLRATALSKQAERSVHRQSHSSARLATHTPVLTEPLVAVSRCVVIQLA